MADASFNDLLKIPLSNPFYKLMSETIGVSINNDLLGPNPTPRQLYTAYSTGAINGVIVDAPEAPWFVRRAAEHDLKALADMRDEPLILEDTPYYAKIKGAGEGKRVLQWHPWLRRDPLKAMKGAQRTGDCFVAGTQVLMASWQTKPIESVKVGDMVLTHLGRARRVSATIRKPYTGKLVLVRAVPECQARTGRVIVTPDHRFAVPVEGTKEAQINWTPASDLKSKVSHVYLGSGQAVPAELEDGVTENDWVYCLEVEEDHSFIANGFVVHNCVSWAIRAAGDALRMLNITLGKWEAYILRGATCGIYSGRGHTGAGASPGLLSNFFVAIGTLLEQVYLGGKYDFRNYDDYVRWGMSRGRVGMPEDLLEETKKARPVKTFLVKTKEACKDVMASGGTIHCGSSLGLSRTGSPFSVRQGSWAHDMWFPCGFDDTREFFPECCWPGDQSWGPWNQVTNIPDAYKPVGEGMYFVRDDVLEAGLRANGTWAFVEMNGFDATPLDNMLI